MSDSSERVLFIGAGQSAVAWYRCYLPAITLGHDWIGVAGEPPKLHYVTGLVQRETKMPRFEDYDVIVVQQPRGTGWLKLIRDLQSMGIRVLYEIDDYVHGIRSMDDHDYADYFDRDGLREMELCMRVCDALICSTEFLARRYRKFNRRTYVCPNGVDMTRYALTRPPRPTVNLGWAGATGHGRAVVAWMGSVARVLVEHDNTCFVSMGLDFATPLSKLVPESRLIAIPFTMLECYPAAMTMIDVAIAPAGKGNFFRGKSDLRWVEAGALGIPVVADPTVYPDIEHGVNGFHASSPQEAGALLAELVADKELRTRVGAQAREDVRRDRDVRVTAGAWTGAFADIRTT